LQAAASAGLRSRSAWRIQLGPTGVRALRWRGVAAAVQPEVGEPEDIVVRAGASGRRLARLPLGRWIAERHGAPYWVMHRGDLYGALDAAAGGASAPDGA
jgi:salicylate hydroxylase